MRGFTVFQICFALIILGLFVIIVNSKKLTNLFKNVHNYNQKHNPQIIFNFQKHKMFSQQVPFFVYRFENSLNNEKAKNRL